MKILDRFGLKVFSIIIIVISIFIIGLRFSLIELEIFNNVIEYLTQENIINNFVLGFKFSISVFLLILIFGVLMFLVNIFSILITIPVPSATGIASIIPKCFLLCKSFQK